MIREKPCSRPKGIPEDEGVGVEWAEEAAWVEVAITADTADSAADKIQRTR